MVKTQFQARIKIFRSDDGNEYFNKLLRKYFVENGFVHQSSCIDIPRQNGDTKRKNRHILEIVRALLFTTKAPKYLWGEAILTSLQQPF